MPSTNGKPAKLRIGSRGSQLALWQANHISALLRGRGHEVEIEIIHTTGDKLTDVALAMVGTNGMFTKEIEEALAADRVDLAVHSLKDLPTELPPGFEIAAITKREDPRDAFCSRHYASFQELPQGARAATTCERALLNSLGGGCQVPIGAFAEMRSGKLHLESIVADPDGSIVLRDSRDGDDPEKLGNDAGAALLARGGGRILEAVYGRGLAIPPQP